MRKATPKTTPGTRQVKPGDVLDGKYRIERLLGEGGMGIVFRALHIELHQRVAVKLLRESAQDAEQVARFMREARAAVKSTSNVAFIAAGAIALALVGVTGVFAMRKLATRPEPPPVPVHADVAPSSVPSFEGSTQAPAPPPIPTARPTTAASSAPASSSAPAKPSASSAKAPTGHASSGKTNPNPAARY